MKIKFLGISFIIAALALFFTLSVTARVGGLNQLHESSNFVESTSLSSKSMSLVGHIGGTAQALDKQGERLYVGIGPRLHIMDVSNPAAPVTLGKTDVLLGNVQLVEAYDDYVFLMTDSKDKLYIFDVVDPVHPVLVADIDQVSKFAISGNFLYVHNLNPYHSSWSSILKVFDITEPANPLEVGSYELSYSVSDMTVDGSYIYLVSGSELKIFDVADPENIEVISNLTIDVPYFVDDIVYYAHYVYIAASTYGVRVIDVSDPLTPFEAYSLYDRTHAVDVTGTRLYVAGSDLFIYDIEDIDHRINVGIYETDFLVEDMVVDGGYAYLALPEKGVDIVDVADAARAYRVGQVAGSGYSNNMQVTGDWAFIPVNNSGLRIVNIADPSTPTDLGNFDEFACVRDVVVQNDLAYLTGCDKVYAVDVTDPVHPLELGFTSAVSNANGIDSDGNYIYVTDQDFGLRVFDVTNLTNIIEVGSLNLAGGVYRVSLSGEVAYVGGESNMYIVDISDPNNPVVLSLIPDIRSRIFTHDNHFVYIFSNGLLYIFDVMDPKNPKLVNTFSHPDIEGPTDIDIENNIIFLPIGSYTMYMVDVSDPLFPYLIDSYSISSSPAGGVDVVGNYAYMTKWNGYVETAYVGGLKMPQSVGGIDAPIDAWEMAVVDNVAYVASRTSGSQVVDITDSSAPIYISSTNSIPSFGNAVISGTYLYDVGDSFRVFDLSDPINPQEIAAIYSSVHNQVVISDNFAYAGGGGLDVMDIADPFNPNRVGHVSFSEPVKDLVVCGNYVYAVDDGGLRVIDVTIPAAPSIIDSISISSLDLIVAVGNYVYVSSGIRLYVFDITDPVSPTEIGFVDPSPYESINALDVKDHYIYASTADGVYIIDVSTPVHPVVVDHLDTPGFGVDLIVRGDMIFVADGSAGLTILSVVEPVSAIVPLSGGVLTSTFDNTSYFFPAGAFTDTVIVTHAYRFPESVPAPPVDLMGIDHFFEVTAVYSSTGQPAKLAPGKVYTVTIQYDDVEVGPAVEDTLSLYYWGDEQWSPDFIDQQLDVADNHLAATLSHFSVWGIMGETHRVFLPIAAND